MKKFLPLLVVFLVVVAGIWFLALSNSKNNTSTNGQTSAKDSADVKANAATGNVSDPGKLAEDMQDSDADDEEDDDGVVDQDEKPASDVYKSADEALKAVKQGASDYDDTILEQFTQPGENCTWCDSFYKSLREMVALPETSEDEKSYYAELLAISGRAENVSLLVDTIKQLGDNEKGDVFAEALELTVGGNDVVKYLGEQLNTDNQLLKESLIAAITNQGSQSAAELLYKQSVQSNDPDGYYSLGIGLGEFVPDESAMPYLRELAQKRDQYSHLAVKSLLNAGVDGLKAVFDVLADSKDPEADRALLKDWTDHLSFDDETESYLKSVVANYKNENIKKIAQEALDSINSDHSEQSGAPMSSMPK